MDDIRRPKPVVPASNGSTPPAPSTPPRTTISITDADVPSLPESVDDFAALATEPTAPADTTLPSAPVLNTVEPTLPSVTAAPELPAKPADPVAAAPTPTAPETAPTASDPYQPTPLDQLLETPEQNVSPEATTPADPPVASTPTPLPSQMPEEPKSEATVSHAPVTSAPRRKGVGAIIAVAVLLAFALIGGAGYAYLQNKKTTKVQTPAATTKEEVTKNPAKASDVEKASSDIDASLKKIDDTKDFQETDLSDATLGL